jgi:uncharacterized protein (DUF2236 family)
MDPSLRPGDVGDTVSVAAPDLQLPHRMTTTTPRTTAKGAPLGPGSLLWSIAGDPRGLITGSAAGLMQLMLPGLGAGVTDHSNFFDDPYDRIFRSIPYIWRSIFSEGDDADRHGRTIRDFHPDIKGVDHHGNRYHALDPDIFWWAHATFTWEFFRARELYFPGRLSRSRQEQLYAETVTWYRRYGVSDRAVPPTLDEFRARFDHICAHELELTPAVRWVLDPATNPGPSQTPKLPGPLSLLDGLVAGLTSDVLRLLVYGSMPDIVRRRFEFRWSDADRIRFASICAALQASGPAIRRGFLAQAWPEGTPHLDPADHRRVVVAGPGRPEAGSRRAR